MDAESRRAPENYLFFGKPKATRTVTKWKIGCRPGTVERTDSYLEHLLKEGEAGAGIFFAGKAQARAAREFMDK